MLKIEVIKFEAQDVITASACAPNAHKYERVGNPYIVDDLRIQDYKCAVCGDEEQVWLDWKPEE